MVLKTVKFQRHLRFFKIMAKSCRNCESKCRKFKQEDEFRRFDASNSQSLLKRYLTKCMYDCLKDKRTPYGASLYDCIQSGLKNLDSGVGIYAPDPEAYTVFAPIFDPIIDDYHGGFNKCAKHPPMDWGDLQTFTNPDPTGQFIISTRIRCGRSLEGFPFNPCLTEAQYKQIEKIVSNSLAQMTGELEGTYYPLGELSDTDRQQLIDDHFLFKEGDRFLQAANACRFWPIGRGIYHNNNKTFLVWINEEDHIRVISMQPGGDIPQIYGRLIEGVNHIEKGMNFARTDRFGFLTFCPTNLGTTIRASVHIKLPKLSSDRQRFEQVAAENNLQIRGTSGEHSEAPDGIYDISNKRRLGLTEYEAVKEMHDGILKLIEVEKSM